MARDASHDQPERTHEHGRGHASSARRSKRRRVLESSELKRQTFYALENVRRGNVAAKVIGIALFALIVANALIIFLSVQPGLDPVPTGPLSVFYKVSAVCFCVEYVARIWIADLAFGDCTRAQARWRYIRSPLGIIDLLSFAPNVISWFVPVTPALISAIGVMRLVRLVKVTRYMRGFRTIGRVIKKHYHEIVAAFLVILLLIVVASVVMYEIEHPVQPQAFSDLLAGVWWAVETVTGTGYGDIVPITPLGRICGSVIMLLGLALVAIPGGIFSAGFVAEYQNANLRKIERDVQRTAHRAADAVEHEGQAPSASAERERQVAGASVERELEDASDVLSDMQDAQEPLGDMRRTDNERPTKSDER